MFEFTALGLIMTDGDPQSNEDSSLAGADLLSGLTLSGRVTSMVASPLPRSRWR